MPLQPLLPKSSQIPLLRFGFNTKNPPKPSEYEIHLTQDMVSSEDTLQLRSAVLCKMRDMLLRTELPETPSFKPKTRLDKALQWVRGDKPEKPFNRTHGFFTIPNLPTLWQSPAEWEHFTSQLNTALLSALTSQYGTPDTQYHIYTHLLDGASSRHQNNTVGLANLHRDGDPVTNIPHLVLLYLPTQNIQPKSGTLILADTLHFCHQLNRPPLQQFALNTTFYQNAEVSPQDARRIKNQYTYEIPWDHDKPLLVVLANRAEAGLFHAGAPFKVTGKGKPVRNIFRAAAVQEYNP